MPASTSRVGKGLNVAVSSSGGVKVDGYLRSSDPHIYAVGEVASYEGGMVYGLWKPGTEQAEVRPLPNPRNHREIIEKTKIMALLRETNG